MSTYIAKVQKIIGQAFPERRILLRSQGDVRYISFSPIRQMFMAFAMFGIAFWTVYATARTLVPISSNEMSQIEIARDRERMATTLNEVRSRRALIQAQLQERGRLMDAAQQRLEAQHYAVRYLIERSGINDQDAFDVIEEDKRLDDENTFTLWFWNS